MEVLFPPFTEMMYKKIDENGYFWIAQPVRSANPIDQAEYKHEFSNKDLIEIETDKIRMRLNVFKLELNKVVDQLRVEIMIPGKKFLVVQVHLITKALDEIERFSLDFSRLNDFNEFNLMMNKIKFAMECNKQFLNKNKLAVPDRTQQLLMQVLEIFQDLKKNYARFKSVVEEEEKQEEKNRPQV